MKGRDRGKEGSEGGKEGRREGGREGGRKGREVLIFCDVNYGVGACGRSGCIIRNPSEAW